MDLRLAIESPVHLAEYARVPIAFEVTQRLDVRAPQHVQPVDPPYVKDYDGIAGNRPGDWASRLDLGTWRFAAAFADRQRLGGAAVVLDHADVAVLWDLRVHPRYRRRGVGRALLAFTEHHARSCGVRVMRVETQDINVPACRLYEAAGYALVEFNPSGYVELPDEVQLIWQKELNDPGPRCG